MVPGVAMPFWGQKDDKTKILYIEDSVEMHEIMKFSVETMGYEYLSAMDGPEGIKLAEKEKPAVILLDINLQSMSGLDVCIHLKKNPATAGIPVFMCTGQSSMSSVETALGCGADGYINKPVNMALLKQKIAKALAGKTAPR
jgi:CheY-like chemotaxis protein